MANLALYRKFRPATFDAIVRQEHVVRVLVNQIARGEVGHAYLFTGPRGTGKTSVARIFARAVNCEHPVNGSPCGKCASCLALANSSLDIVEIDAASNNGVNEMRDLREKVQYPPVSTKYKVYIIDEVHMLTDSAFNALLKTLEEPPAHAVFILATTEPHKIPATILSRCMRLDFKLIPEEDLERHLTKILDEMHRQYEKEAVAAIARAGAGSDRDMLSIAQMCLSYGETLTYQGVTSVLGAADFSTTAKLVSCLLRSDAGGVLSVTERLLAEGKGVGVLLRDLLTMLNRVAVAKSCANAQKLLCLPEEMFEQVGQIARAADGAAVLRATDILARTETELRFSSSPRISLETALLRAAMPQTETDTDALLVRIAALERQVAALSSGESVPAARPVERISPEERVAVGRPAERISVGETPSAPPQDDALQPPPSWEDEPEPYAPARSVPVGGGRASVEGLTESARDEETPFFESPSAPTMQVGLPDASDSAEMLFGMFLRKLRKLPKSGVLYTLCRDLAASKQGDTLVLTTDVRTICDTLNREKHASLMQEVFSEMGVSSFEVRYNSPEQRDERKGVEQIKRDFSDYPIELK